MYTSDGKRLIVVEAGIARIWDLGSGREARPAIRIDPSPELPRNRSADTRAALSADSRFLATCGSADGFAWRRGKTDPTIRIWELDSGQEVTTLPGEEGSVSGLAFSPDGRLLAAHGGVRPTKRYASEPQPQDRIIRVFDLASGQESRRLEGHRGTVNSIAFTPDGHSLVSGSEDATALVWDVSDLRGQMTRDEAPNPESLQAHWNALAGQDARAAYRATWALSVSSAMRFLRDHLRPAKAVEPIASPEVLRTVRAITALERINTPEARGAIERLVQGHPDAVGTREAKLTLDRLNPK